MNRRDELERHVDLLGNVLELGDLSPLQVVTLDIVGILRERRITLAELAELGDAGKGSVVDDLAAKRRRRRDAAAKAAASST